MDRRSFLGLAAGAGLVALSGCTDRSPGPSPTGSAPPTSPPGDDDGLREATFAAEQRLVTLYAAAIATAAPELGARLRAVQVQHVQHAQRLRPELPVATDPPTPSPATLAPPSTPAPTSGPGGSAEPSGVETPASPGAGPSEPGPTDSTTGGQPPTPRPQTVVANLRRAELAAIEQRSAACELAKDPELARSLCLIAASEAQHADVLRALRAELGR